jgi:hypothetical protein
MVDVEAFLAQWGLDEGARFVLTQMAPESQARIIADFQPKQHTRNVTGLFYGFCKSIEGAEKIDQLRAAVSGASSDPVESYGARDASGGLGGEPQDSPADYETWCADKGLDASCLETLLSLDEGLRARVVGPGGFAPKPGTKNPSSLFMSYVRSIASGPKGASKGGGAAYGSPAAVSNGSYHSGGHGKGRPAGAAGSHEADVMQFLRTWQLDSECESMMLQAPISVQREMMSTFSPKAETRDVKRLFIGFLKSISRSSPQAQAWDSPRYPQYAAPAAGHSSSWSPSVAWEPPVAAHELHDFGQSWGLDAECVAALLGQPTEVQRAVLERFRPKETTRDVKRLFMSFLTSLTSGGKGSAGTKGGPVGAGHYAAHTKGYGGKGSWSAKGQYQPMAHSIGAPQARSALKRPADYQDSGSPPSESELTSFIETWGIDDKCIEMLIQQSGTIQRHVIERFQPKQDTKDVSNLFMGFLKSFMYGPNVSKRPRGP